MAKAKTTDMYADMQKRGTAAYDAGMAQLDQEKIAQARKLIAEHTSTAYEGAKTLLRASHIINQYISLAAGGTVCASAVIVLGQIILGAGLHRSFFQVVFGALTQFYIFIFGLGIIVLEIPIVEHTKPVLAFKVFLDKWLRAFSRLSARGLVYLTHGVLIIDAQSDISTVGVWAGSILFIAGLASTLAGVLTSYDILQLRERVRAHAQRDGKLVKAQQVFASIDTNKDGWLSKKEMLALAKLNFPEMNELEVDAMFMALDANRDGTVSLEEFMIWYDREQVSAEDFA